MAAERLHDQPTRREPLIEQAIELTRRLITLGRSDLEALRRMDKDFAPLQNIDAFQAMLREFESK